MTTTSTFMLMTRSDRSTHWLTSLVLNLVKLPGPRYRWPSGRAYTVLWCAIVQPCRAIYGPSARPTAQGPAHGLFSRAVPSGEHGSFHRAVPALGPLRIKSLSILIITLNRQ